MKKITSLLLFLSAVWGYSQVNSYTFSQSNGTYSEITAGNLLGSPTTDQQRFVDSTATATAGSLTVLKGLGLPIGFKFKFNGYEYDRFGINANGWISLGSSALGATAVDMTNTNSTNPIGSAYSTIPTPADLSARISVFGTDLAAQSTSSLRYQTVGDKGSRVLIVQWKNYRRSSKTESFNFQIRLNEGSNTVEFVYGDFTFTDFAFNMEVGLRADTTLPVTNFVSRKAPSNTTSWANTVASVNATDKLSMNGKVSPIVVPASGLTFIWSPPACGSLQASSISGITASSAAISWTYYSPASDGYEYIASTSATAPLATDSGTAVSGNEKQLSDLNSNTTYYVFLRSNCAGVFTPWVSLGTFKTKCIEYETLSENFNSYTNISSNNVVPDCWVGATVAGRCYIKSGVGKTGLTSNGLSMYTGSATTIAYATLPAVSTLPLGTYRLRFKAYALVTGKKIDIGYNDASGTFVLITTKDLPAKADDIQEFIVTPGVLNAKNLVFRNSINGSTVYIDDVFWEPTPPCENVKSVAVKGVLHNSVNLSWESTGAETQWQYAYAPSSVTDLTTLNPVDADSKSVVVTGLMPSTSYKIWVRSDCHGSYGIWIASEIFTTTCDPVSTIKEDFDAGVAFPPCWSKVANSGGKAEVTNLGSAATAPNALAVSSALPSSMAVVALPPVNNAAAGTHRLRFKIMGDKVIGAKLEIGYLKEAADAASFVAVTDATVSSTTEFVYAFASLGTVPTTPYLAFRNPSTSGTYYIYVDDVMWEPIPSCPDVSAPSTSAVTHNSVKVSWTGSGTEQKWEYAMGVIPSTDPDGLNAVEVTSTNITVKGLTPSTTYKVWIRSKCNDGSVGSWFGPALFTTNCPPVGNFIQSFDGSTDFPTCWRKVGTQGQVSVATISGSNYNALKLGTRNPSAKAVVSIQPVTGYDDSSHWLRFKLSGSTSYATVEVGYLTNYLDASTFHPLKTYAVNTDLSYKSIIADLGFEPASQVLAFRNPGIDPTGEVENPSDVYIDEVIWEEVPPCPDVANFKINTIKSNSVDIQWESGGLEDTWQYVKGDATASDPIGLTPQDVYSTSITVGGLQPSTSYKIWVRSKCNAIALGSWHEPVVFTTTCTPVAEFTENFDGNTTLPACWKDVYGTGVSVVAVAGPSSPNVLKLNAKTGLVAMRPANNTTIGTNRLKFKFRGSAVGADLQVGYLTNVNDSNSFVLIEGFKATSTTSYDYKVMLMGTKPGSEVLAFRSPSDSPADVFIDNVIWEAIAPCSDIAVMKTIALTSTSVDINWAADDSASKAQYVVAPSSTTSPEGITPVDVDALAMQIGDLKPSTSYKVWMRTRCLVNSVGYWSDPLIFTTACLPVDNFTENFDAATALPVCWNQIGSQGQGTASVVSLSNSNVLRLNSTTAMLPVVVNMPPVNHSGDATHRLKFRLAGNTVHAALEVGYLTSLADPASFVPVKVFQASANSSFESIVTTLGTEPTTEFLAFRNPGGINGSVFIDNVIWEAIPACADISNVTLTGVTSNTVGLTWTPAASENQWQYGIADSTVNDTNLLTAVTVDSSTITIDKLSPSKSYKVWIRSKCGTDKYGGWSEPISFTTTCPPISYFTENFDSAMALPACWAKVGSKGTVSVAPATGTGYSNVLTLTSDTTDPAVVGVLPLDNSVTGTHRFRFQLSGIDKGDKLEVGYLTNVTNPSSFVKLKTYIVNASNVYQNEVAEMGTDAKSQILAFRNGTTSSTIYIDNLIWEPLPTCPDVNSFAIKSIASNSVNLTWAPSTATKWQYAVGSTASTNPDLLEHIDVDASDITADKLATSTTYKVWARAKCGDSFGLWSAPLTFTTTCTAVSEFSENFDAVQALPSCWKKIGNQQILPVLGIVGTSLPNILYLKNTSPDEKIIMTMPPVNNVSDGTHRLRFSMSGTAVGASVEVGYMMNPQDSASFVPLQTYPATDKTYPVYSSTAPHSIGNIVVWGGKYWSNKSGSIGSSVDNSNLSPSDWEVISLFETKILEIGIAPASPVLAFRNSGSITVYIDDVIWEAMPCDSQVSGLAYNSVTNKSVGLKWNATGAATHWQYSLLEATKSYPESATAVVVDSKDILVNNLQGNTTYKVWVRAKCDQDDTFGIWSQAITFKTPCNPVDGFTEHFDVNTKLPSCWAKVGGEGMIDITTASDAPSGTNILRFNNSYNSVVKPVLTIQPISNIAEGTHRLKFKFRTSVPGISMEVGYLTDASDAGSFVVVKSFPSTQANMFETAVVEFANDLPTQIVALRFPEENHFAYAYVDDVSWEVRPVVTVPNDEIATAIALTVGPDFDTNAIMGTNVTATGTNQIIQPGCGGYNGGDVWYSAIVPASKNITFEVANVAGGLTNLAAAVYSDNSVVACADSTINGHPIITLNGRNEGELLYLRVWEKGADASGTFKVSAYTDLSLGTDEFNNSNFNYYPNPVKDILNISLGQEISDVVVLNMLGQQVISKSVKANTAQVDMSGLSKGTYLVKITSANQTKTVKAVKE